MAAGEKASKSAVNSPRQGLWAWIFRVRIGIVAIFQGLGGRIQAHHSQVRILPPSNRARPQPMMAFLNETEKRALAPGGQLDRRKRRLGPRRPCRGAWQARNAAAGIQS
jgi:hypothetical protein